MEERREVVRTIKSSVDGGVGETMEVEVSAVELGNDYFLYIMVVYVLFRLLSQTKDILTYEDQTTSETKLELPAQVLAEHSVNTRKTQKLMYTQLQVLKFLLDFLDSAPRIQDASDSAVRKEMEEAKKQWKALKADYQQQVEAIKGAVPQILAKQEEVQSRARLLEEALQRYRAKELLRERQQQLEQQVVELQDRLQKQQKELECLQGENDMEVELTSPPQPEISAPRCLKLHLHWGKDGNVTLQARKVGTEFYWTYFAIDWQPEKRLLSYLKPSSTCSLFVESGYPANGQIHLLSVKTQQGTVDVTSYK
ncbi:hypothetical protein Chor_007082, partial [Crotalus horridus]